ncbi:MAG TPA: hypothetical protein PKZ42_12745 [Syntrophales bacterium]|nr:hypothetical protein [Syntrophales bacterium]
MIPEKLVIFDYSGTLSLNAVSFGEDDTLRGELERSGLAGLGIADPETFWREIVNPTWQEGSTTSIGYRRLICRRIREKQPLTVPDSTIRLSAERFVDSYLGHSTIDVQWRSILQKLHSEASAVILIATDHYAEATGYIVRYLGEIGIRAVPLKDAADVFPSSFIVVNSADLGVHKADRRFWEIVRNIPGLTTIRSALIIDDFGYNEEEGDSYADRHKVESRKNATIDLLEGVFRVQIHAIPFFLTGKDEKTRGDFIREASLEIQRWLS